MIIKYYVDTSIWIDLLENRKGYNNEPLGDYALRLFSIIRSKKYNLIISDRLIRELESFYSLEEINGMIKPFEDIIIKIVSTNKQREEAKRIAKERNLPPGDVLHTILARDNNLFLITRDKDFDRLIDICAYNKPEDII